MAVRSPAQEPAIEENVTRGGANVLDGVLNTPADDGQGVDAISGVNDGSGTGCRDGSDGGVDLKVAVGLAVVELHVAARSKEAEHLTGIVSRNQLVDWGVLVGVPVMVTGSVL